jgi:hypothetical protein
MAKATRPWASATKDGFVTQLWPSGGTPRLVTLLFAQGDLVAPATMPLFRVELAEGSRVVSAELRVPDGLTATALQRFPWARWLTIVKETARSEGAAEAPGDSARDPALSRLVQAATEGKRLRTPVPAPKRPGRRGHPESLYRGVGELYAQLCAEGDPHPRATLANQMNYSPNTMAGLLRKARERGFLRPPDGKKQ